MVKANAPGPGRPRVRGETARSRVVRSGSANPGRAPTGKASTTHRFGSHLSIAGGLSNAIESALQLGFDTVQVFVKNQRQWAAAPLRDDDLQRWFELRASPGFGPPIAHATYLINLASADDRLYERSIAAFAEELQRCQTLDIPYLVFHPGAPVAATAEAGIERVAAAIDAIFDQNPTLRTMPLLETTAGQGSTLGRTFTQLGEIVSRLRQPQRVGVCVDTCHVFAAGYDIRSPQSYDAMMDEAARSVGLERILCWHLNDSLGALGSHVDRHAHIGLGEIGPAGFRNVLHDERFRGVPMILETPKELDERGREWDRVNTARLRRIAVARPTH